MSFSRIVLAVLVLSVAPCSAQSLLQLLSPQLQALLPSAAIPPAASLTLRDIQVAQAMALQFPQFSGIQQLLKTLAVNSPTLNSLLNQAILKAQQQIALTKAQLLPAAQQFLSDVGLIGKSAVKQSIDLLKSQEPLTLQNLQNTFPTTSSLIQTPVAQEALPLLLPA